MTTREQFQHVFNVSYIFDFSNMILTVGDRMYMIVGFLMVVLGSVFQVIGLYSKNPVSRLMWYRLASPLGVGGILEVFWYVARYENINLFGSHFVAWGIGIVVLVWIFFPIRYLLGRYNKERVNWEKQQIKLKYIQR